jgi:hypothetical protein
LKSPAVQEFSKNLYVLYQHALEHGFWSTLQQLVDSLDPLGEKNALRVGGFYFLKKLDWLGYHQFHVSKGTINMGFKNFL